MFPKFRPPALEGSQFTISSAGEGVRCRKSVRSGLRAGEVGATAFRRQREKNQRVSGKLSTVRFLKGGRQLSADLGTLKQELGVPSDVLVIPFSGEHQ